MSDVDLREALAKQVDEASVNWRQGDLVYGLFDLKLVDIRRPLMSDSDARREQDGTPITIGTGYDGTDAAQLAVIESEAESGHVIITQTCDAVRRCVIQPYLQLCPIVRLPSTKTATASRWRNPQYAPVSGAGPDLFVDLSRPVTVEKTLLLGQEPKRGFPDDEARRRFAGLVARRYGRFAFPDEFHDAFKPLADRIVDKHGKTSAEGILLRDQLYQVRAQALPNWVSNEIEVVLHFILNVGVLLDPEQLGQLSSDSATRPPAAVAQEIVAVTDGVRQIALWRDLIRGWLALCNPQAPIKSFVGLLTETSQFSLEQMRWTEEVDFDNISSATR